MTDHDFTEQARLAETYRRTLTKTDFILARIESIHDLLSYLEEFQSASEIDETRSHLLMYIEKLTTEMRREIDAGKEFPCT